MSLSPTGAELQFEVLSQCYERRSTFVTSNLTFEEWTRMLGSERLIGALLDRRTRADGQLAEKNARLGNPLDEALAASDHIGGLG